MITSLHNPRIKDAAKLRERKGRDAQGRIIVDGAREIALAARSGVELIELFVCRELLTNDRYKHALAAGESAQAEVIDVSPQVFERLAFGERGEGIIATARTPRRTLAGLTLPESPLVAVIEGVEKPGNVGAALRSADGAGVAALIVADGATDLFNPNAIRASLGAIFTVPVCAASSAETLAWLRARRLALFAARVDGAIPYHTANYRQPSALILGSEAQGLSATWRGSDIQAIQLPMLGVVDSLNVSVTAGVLFYEARRQRETR